MGYEWESHEMQLLIRMTCVRTLTGKVQVGALPGAAHGRPFKLQRCDVRTNGCRHLSLDSRQQVCSYAVWKTARVLPTCTCAVRALARCCQRP